MAALQIEVQGVAGITSEIQASRKGGVMHIVDLDGRIYERQKREQRRELSFALIYAGSLILALVLVLCMGGN